MKNISAVVQFRALMIFFIAGLVFAGVTAFPLPWELDLLSKMLGVGDAVSAEGRTGLTFWILTVKHGLADTYAKYPWVAYGTDWLAFGHLVIAGFFVGPLINPVSGRATLYTGMAACVAVIPLAMIGGPIRGIPLYWQLIDCSFGVIGILPLLYSLKLIGRIEREQPGGK